MDQKTVVHLHSGILQSRKKEGTSTVCNNMDVTGEYYAKWNKLVCERQIPYDLIYKRNLINKIKQWAKYNQRHRSMEQTDSGQRGGARGIMVERRGRDQTKNMYEWLTDMDNSVGIDCGSGGGMGRIGQRGKYWDSCNRIIKNDLIKKYSMKLFFKY